MSMENNPNTAHTPATKGDLDTLEGKLGVKMEQLLSKQTKAIRTPMDWEFHGRTH